MSNKIVKFKNTPVDPLTQVKGTTTAYHFEIDREYYNQYEYERTTSPKNRNSNFILSSFAEKVSTYSEPIIEKGEVKKDGEWVEKPMSKESFHALIQTVEWGVPSNLFALELQAQYGGHNEVEVFLG